MKLGTVIRFVASLFVALTSTYAEKVDGPGEAEANSTHILSGSVTGIYSKQVTSAKYETAYYVAEVRVNSVEKGEGYKPGQVIYVRYWGHLKWLGEGSPEPGPSGHENKPKEGDKRRICLVRGADGALDVYYVGGFKNPGEKEPIK